MHWLRRAVESAGMPCLLAVASVLTTTILPGILMFRLALLWRIDWDLTDSEFITLLVLIAILLSGLATFVYAYLLSFRSHNENERETRCRESGDTILIS